MNRSRGVGPSDAIPAHFFRAAASFFCISGHSASLTIAQTLLEEIVAPATALISLSSTFGEAPVTTSSGLPTVRLPELNGQRKSVSVILLPSPGVSFWSRMYSPVIVSALGLTPTSSSILSAKPFPSALTTHPTCRSSAAMAR